MLSLEEDEYDLNTGTLVAFAACVLDFPVAYVPTSDSDTAYLAGAPLDVYQCVLEADPIATTRFELPNKHVVIKFSCPQNIAQTDEELHPEALVSRLETQLGDRMQAAGFPGRVTVRHSTETLDRVGL
ncbi:hypothetical protein BD414DRAFT_274381 [Trametes punicea]|nr:hypothetical protein BD414DRAFT_274381 [Trametes punicea]